MIHARPILCRPRIGFVDPCCASGYDLETLATSGLGGTEATTLRIATALQSQFDIVQFQQRRSLAGRTHAGELRPLDEVYDSCFADALVVINRWKVAVKLRKLYPDVPILLWLHVHPGQHNRRMGAALKDASIGVICVSHSHAKVFAAFLETKDVPSIQVIYNPIADDLHPDKTPRDPNRLLFASSPHKGLCQVFEQFSALRETLPDLTLAVADPGYLRWRTGPAPDRVFCLGSLSHTALLRQMRRSLCLFYPQTSFSETFGLVLAEANAVGTPALVHAGLGANDEVVSNGDQLVDGHDPGQILSQIARWRESPPVIAAKSAFRLRNVTQCWVRVLTDAMTVRTHVQIGAGSQ